MIPYAIFKNSLCFGVCCCCCFGWFVFHLSSLPIFWEWDNSGSAYLCIFYALSRSESVEVSGNWIDGWIFSWGEIDYIGYCTRSKLWTIHILPHGVHCSNTLWSAAKWKLARYLVPKGDITEKCVKQPCYCDFECIS